MGRWLRVGLRGVFAMLLGLLLVEGAASVWHFAATAAKGAPSPLAERLHTRYDPELGWVNAPNVRLPDLYGPGCSLSTNARGFRGAAETADAAAPGTTRVVCSGDSFTLGYGVSDEETFCARLGALGPGVEAINMGQGGYGIDQAYLWFRRDGRPLAPKLHLFAFIHEDFLRMESDRFLGYGKPVLEVKDGRLVPRNVPVPRGAYDAPWATRALPLLDELRAFRLLHGVAAGLVPEPPARRPNDALLPLSLRVFEELRSLNAARGGELVLVYLPMREDLRPDGRVDAWRELVVTGARARGLRVLDLVPDLRALPLDEAARLFLGKGEIAYRAAEGHYTAEGNARVARLLASRLAAEGLLAAPRSPD